MLMMFKGLRKRLGWGSREDDSDDEDDAFRERVAKKIQSRRPPNTAFRQQRLQAWQPVLTAKVVIPLLLLVAVIFIPIGIGIFLATYNVEQLKIDYSNCDNLARSSYTEIPKKLYSYHFKKSKSSTAEWKYDSNKKTCTVQFEIPNDIKGNLFMYYKLTNFYQNHRKYVESYDWKQLRGEAVPHDEISKKCEPLRYRDDKIIYPAGLVANSMFNDTFSNLTYTGSEGEDYEFSYSGIAWSSDLSIYKKTGYNISDIVPPPNWAEKYPNGYTEDDLEAIAKDEHFMNWMKTAALPSFMKLYGQNKNKGEILKTGKYSVDIQMNYPVTVFGGSKSLVITTSSVIGGRHVGLGVCYLVAGGVAVVFMLLFLVKQLLTRSKREHAFFDSLNDGHPLNSDPVGMRQVL